jgi:hypothetical protein
MTPRVGESLEDFKLRRNAADRAREARRWVASRRVVNHDAGTETTTYIPERESYERPAGYVPDRISVNVDGEGNVTQRWEKLKLDDQAKWEAVQAAIDEMHQTLPRVTVDYCPPAAAHDTKLVGYPIGDHHMGMLAWWREVGASYDLDIGEALLTKAVDYLVDRAPPAKQALIVGLGDFLHYDSMSAVTPKHGHILDQDSRAGKMVRAGVRVMRRIIERAAMKHEHVHVIFEPGNHDPFSALWMKELLATKYEDEPRITVDTDPGAFHHYRFGKNLIATHHGDTVRKLDKLPGIMASDWPDDWAATTHRVWWTGHTHAQEWQSYNGCNVEVFPILPPPDAYAHMLGYHKIERKMQAIVFDFEDGEVERYSFRPEMVK